MIKSVRIIDKGFSKEQFNNTAGHPLQAWEWGEARSKMGLEVLRIGEFDGKKLQNVYQLTFHQIPFTCFKIGYLPRSAMPSKEALNFLADYSRKNKTIFIKIEPYVKKLKTKNDPFDYTQDFDGKQFDPEFTAEGLSRTGRLQQSRTDKKLKIQTKNEKLINLNHSTIQPFSHLKSSPHPLFPNWTIQLDITKPEEKLLKNMKSKTRYNIRLAQKKGVYVKEMTDRAGFEIFADLYFKTTKRQKYYGHDYHYHKTIFDTLKGEIIHILISFYKKTPVSAYEVFLFKDTIYYPYGGSSEEYRNLMASNLLMWEIIKFGKKQGAKIFDMWGSLSPDYDKSHPWAGFTRFKQGFGGEFVEFVGSYDLMINIPLYKIYGKLYNIRQAFLKLVK